MGGGGGQTQHDPEPKPPPIIMKPRKKCSCSAWRFEGNELRVQATHVTVRLCKSLNAVVKDEKKRNKQNKNKT